MEFPGRQCVAFLTAGGVNAKTSSVHMVGSIPVRVAGARHYVMGTSGWDCKPQEKSLHSCKTHICALSIVCTCMKHACTCKLHTCNDETMVHTLLCRESPQEKRIYLI